MILHTKEIKIPIYFGKLIIFFVESITDLNEKFNINAEKTYDSYVFKKLSKSNCMCYHIAIKHDITNPIIAHETTHIVNYIFEHVGIELDIYNDEAQAYLTGWVFEQIELFLKEINYGITK